MRRKETIFVCIVAVCTVLIVAADTANDGEEGITTTELPKKLSTGKKLLVDDGEEEIPTTELPKITYNLTCGPPPEIEDSILPQIVGNEHPIRTSVTYSCNYGFVSRNSINHISYCVENKATGRAEWTVPEIGCIPRSCGDPGYVNKGRRIGNLFTFPNKVEFECEDGYRLVGLKARFCQAGGDWSGRLPSCEPIFCSVPPDLANGEVLYSSLEYGAELKYRCYIGYMETHRESRYCDEDGIWSGEAPECIETRCIRPVAPENGEVNFAGEPKVGSIATYSCHPGFTLHGASRTKCLNTGQWTFGPPKCSRSCLVPHIENGEIGKVSVRYISKWRGEETFAPLSDGDLVDHNVTLSFRCNKDFAIVEDDTILKDDRVNVTCYDGKWSRNLLCRETTCLGDPPKIENGVERVNSRRHGHTIWYQCDDPKDKKIAGNVTCDFGTWIGVPPQCISTTPCYSKDLDFPGLVKPSKSSVSPSESFDIVCKQGYRLSTLAKIITCKRGKWNITEDPCPPAHDDAEQIRPAVVAPVELNAAEKSPSSSNQQISNPRPPNQCRCTFVGAGLYVQATVDSRRLKDGDKVRKGKTVTFSCKGPRMLVWGNGFRKYGNASVTCTTCQRWEVSDNPDCRLLEMGGPFIVLEENVSLQPGGEIEVAIKKPITIRCASTSYYPLWSFRERPMTNVEYDKKRNGNVEYYFTIIHITEITYDNEGRYTCYFNPPTTLRYTVVDLRVRDKCPLLAANQFVTYSNGNEIGSLATFSCPKDTSLVGSSKITCQDDATWSSLEPYCSDVVCNFFPTGPDRKVSYSDDNRIGSRATFSCAEHAILHGPAKSVCRNNGTWSSSGPSCLNKTTCPLFPQASWLKIKYSNGNFAGSNASFSCSSQKSLNGNSFAVCRENGSWSHQKPSCEDKCSLDLLLTSLGKDIVPDMRDITDDLVPYGSKVPLLCEGKLIPEGNSIAECGEQNRWEIGIFQCTSGCFLNIEPSSRLQVKPLKDSYRFGENVILSCSSGDKMTNDVERLMCLGEQTWSDPIPDCIKA